MKCKKRKICNTCGAPFKMARGCYLEKRCPACRELDVSKGKDSIYSTETDLIHIPMHVKDHIKDIDRVQNMLYMTRNNNDYEDPEIIGGILGLTTATIKKYLKAKNCMDINRVEKIDNHDTCVYGKNYQIHPEQIVDNEDLREQINNVLDFLNDRERTVIKLRLGLVDDLSDRTLEEIGLIIGTNRERVRQIESEAINKIKHPRVGKSLRDYVYGE